MNNRKKQAPTIKIVYESKGDGLKAAYRHLAKRIVEERLYEVRHLCKSEH